MRRIERIESVDDPRLTPFRNLKAQNAVRDARLFIAEGPTVVERVLRSKLEVAAVLVSDRKWNHFQDRLRDDVCVLRVGNVLAEELVGFDFHAGVAASVVRPPKPRIEDVVPAEGSSLILAGDRITDPENVGALIRIASAFGADGVILGPGSADPYSRRVLRVSMGNVLFLPIVQTNDLVATLDELHRSFGFLNCATVLDENAISLSVFRFETRSLLLFGNEYDGISAAVRGHCQKQLTIPMLNGTDSLNIAISAGIFAYQYRCRMNPTNAK